MISLVYQGENRSLPRDSTRSDQKRASKKNLLQKLTFFLLLEIYKSFLFMFTCTERCKKMLRLQNQILKNYKILVLKLLSLCTYACGNSDAFQMLRIFTVVWYYFVTEKRNKVVKFVNSYYLPYEHSPMTVRVLGFLSSVSCISLCCCMALFMTLQVNNQISTEFYSSVTT